MKSKRTQAERTAGTRAALVAAARPLFATRGYAAVGTDEIASAAGVTRGALYHQFGGKEELFVAVFEQVEQEIVHRLAAGAAGAGAAADPFAALEDDIGAWLTVCAEPEIHRIVLIEAPAALGWERWREIGRGYGVGLVELVVQGLVDAGAIAPQPVRPLAHVLVGALEEAALYAARAQDRTAATAEVRAALVALVRGLVR
ncbi:TetR/AcrR family transcriptional regulator [Nocardioides sp.]|uniref:TetR/AcrR family transcriptional regulator n=1 Tax=Nocardioides sp. TaxID=35761 RepID=UPI00271E431A|nr:TetR/AcrR family transcriptional regulator [Nocardioides sp.]MDO9457965.1 TetR/AcrR family transcriptional regulator [Nocardioides sp.]